MALDGELTAEANRIYATPGSDEVHLNDPRLEKYIRCLLGSMKESREWSINLETSLRDIAWRIASRRTDPADPGNCSSELSALRNIVASLSGISLETELRDITVAVSGKRNACIIARYFGWDGHRPCTLQSVGDRYGLTRERIRQISERFAANCQNKKSFSPVLRRALELVESRLPGLAAQIELDLVQRGIAGKSMSVEGLISAAQLFKQQVNFRIETLRGKRFVVSNGTRSWAREISQIARAIVRCQGAADVTIVAERMNQTYALSLLPSYVSAILQARSDLVWLGDERIWFWLSSGQNGITKRIRKVLSVFPLIPISQLHTAAFRALPFDLPEPIFVDFCRQLPVCRVDRGYIVARTRLNRNSQLCRTEQLMFRILTENGPLLSWFEIESLYRAAGMSSKGCTHQLLRSPIIARYARGLYGLIGARISQRASINHKATVIRFSSRASADSMPIFSGRERDETKAAE